MSSSTTLCNLMLEQSDLIKLQQLDPFQTQGFKTIHKTSIPIRIIYSNEIGNEVSDLQQLTIQILSRMVKGPYVKGGSNNLILQQLRLFITSEDDLYLNFVSNCTQATFESMRDKNSLNIKFNDFPNVLIGILHNCKDNGTLKHINEAQLKLSYEGTGRLFIKQQTQYKRLQLIELFFTNSNVERTNQSIIYRFNYQTTKLAMLQNSIQSVYELLQKKNQPLLQYIQKTVGINEQQFI